MIEISLCNCLIRKVNFRDPRIREPVKQWTNRCSKHYEENLKCKIKAEIELKRLGI